MPGKGERDGMGRVGRDGRRSKMAERKMWMGSRRGGRSWKRGDGKTVFRDTRLGSAATYRAGFGLDSDPRRTGSV